MELPSIVSHMISYTRLLGILLASFVLAYVIDKEAVGTSAEPGLMLGGIGFAIGGSCFWWQGTCSTSSWAYSSLGYRVPG